MPYAGTPPGVQLVTRPSGPTYFWASTRIGAPCESVPARGDHPIAPGPQQPDDPRTVHDAHARDRVPLFQERAHPGAKDRVPPVDDGLAERRKRPGRRHQRLQVAREVLLYV